MLARIYEEANVFAGARIAMYVRYWILAVAALGYFLLYHLAEKLDTKNYGCTEKFSAGIFRGT